MEKLILKGFGYFWGGRDILLESDSKRRTKKIYDDFLYKICELKGIPFTPNVQTEYNYNALKYGVTAIELYDCGSYYSIRFPNGRANFTKDDNYEIVII